MSDDEVTSEDPLPPLTSQPSTSTHDVANWIKMEGGQTTADVKPDIATQQQTRPMRNIFHDGILQDFPDYIKLEDD